MTTTVIGNLDRAIVDLKQIDMQPARDPLRSRVFHAAERAVRDVSVDGAQVVADGRDQARIRPIPPHALPKRKRA